MAWAPVYATDSELKDMIGIDSAADDTLLGYCLASSSRSVDRACGRQFGQTSLEERSYSPEWYETRGLWVCHIDDVQDVTGLVIETADGTALSPTQYDLEPLNSAERGKPFTKFSTAISTTLFGVLALFGWSAVPTTIKMATLLQASRLYSRRNSPHGIAGSPESGTELRLLDRLDPDVAEMLRDYTRWTTL